MRVRPFIATGAVLVFGIVGGAAPAHAANDGSSACGVKMFAARAGGGLPTVSVPGHGYAFNTVASAPYRTSYPLAGPYSYNSAGGANTAVHWDKGSYGVCFGGLVAAGTVLVTAVSDDRPDLYCTVASWSVRPEGTAVEVRCFDGAGGRADARCTVRATGSPDPPAGAYLLADQPTAAAYTAALPHQYNSTGAANTVERFGVGFYVASLPGLAATAGHVQVTGYGDTGLWCKVGGWGPSPWDPGAQLAFVHCHTAAGTLADAPFTLTYVRDADVLLAPSGVHGYGYAWADDPLSGGYAPSPTYTTGAWTGRAWTGRYKVHFPLDLDRGLVHVTAYGFGDERCAIATWSTAGGVVVNCWSPAGGPADAQYDVAFVHDYRPAPATARRLPSRMRIPAMSCAPARHRSTGSGRVVVPFALRAPQAVAAEEHAAQLIGTTRPVWTIWSSAPSSAACDVSGPWRRRCVSPR